MFMDIQDLKNITVIRKTIAQMLGYKNDNYTNELVKDHGASRNNHNEYPKANFELLEASKVESAY